LHQRSVIQIRKDSRLMDQGPWFRTTITGVVVVLVVMVSASSLYQLSPQMKQAQRFIGGLTVAAMEQ